MGAHKVSAKLWKLPLFVLLQATLGINLSHAEMSKMTKGPGMQQLIEEDSVAVHAAGAAKRSANTESGRGSWGSESGYSQMASALLSESWLKQSA